MTTLSVTEIFKSIQGESTYAGLPCVFVRLSGCNLRCCYCDTKYSYKPGIKMNIKAVLRAVEKYACGLVEITGGEPLLQKGAFDLAVLLADKKYKVLVETNGSVDISVLDQRCVVIMDIKCPSSGMNENIFWKNINHLKASDEIKFVIANRKDYIWAKNVIIERELANKFTVLFSPSAGKLSAQILAAWILKDKLPVRLNLQLHKYIWGGAKKK